MFVFVCPDGSLGVCLSTCHTVYLSVCLSDWLSVCLSIQLPLSCRSSSALMASCTSFSEMEAVKATRWAMRKTSRPIAGRSIFLRT